MPSQFVLAALVQQQQQFGLPVGGVLGRFGEGQKRRQPGISLAHSRGRIGVVVGVFELGQVAQMQAVF